MDLIEVDALNLKPAQASLKGALKVFGATVVPYPAAVVPGQTALGRHHKSAAVFAQRLGEDFLRMAESVGVGRVEEIYVMIPCAMDGRDGFVVVNLAPARAAHGPAAKSLDGNGELRLPQGPMFHSHSPHELPSS